ncbi:L-histidine N(alpha)-methyltransferase [Alcanivorax sp. S6407]|uniref:L-histidine N(alpha)-methyltransferase n=1 Tax=Alcanivorax sp. S6407 TaxID=2926424 RepID=UPI001FF54D9A|nr:L-histidine N(alpha)-methyltransferase [Alcanivorax sp. S6407]MCK0155105.1 L-histidine N(alpha)-methyltransferase [Alcanivorax sp. S6407]
MKKAMPVNQQQLGPNLTFYDLHPPATDMLEEVTRSLSAPRPHLHPKYFYNETGSRLFDAITATPEYYPTRTESALLTRYSDEIQDQLGGASTIAEPGAGSCQKVRLLLERWSPECYMPLEISRDCLLQATRELSRDFPGVQISAVCADYCQALSLPADKDPNGRVVFFPGSTIGNFEPAERQQFLRGLHQLAGPGGSLLIGADLHKDCATLHAAYNDAEGLTAAFNLNALHHINHELDCHFQVEQMRHLAFYNEQARRIEMHLECLCDQQLQLGENRLTLPAGTRIHTENSYKFTVEGFTRELINAGFTPRSCWTDPDNLFSLHLASY